MYEMKIEKIGTISYVNEGKEYFTEFNLTPKVKDFLKEEEISLACLIQDAWSWYEANLFYTLHETKNNKFGLNFKVIYFGIIESRDYVVEEIIEKGFEENINEFTKEEIEKGEIGLSSVKDPNKSFKVKYILIKK